MRIACRNQLARRHNNQRVGTLDAVHGVHNGFFNRAALEAFLNNGVYQHLGVVRGTENAAVQFDLAAQLACVYEVAVVRNREIALYMGDGDRLRILAAGIAGGGVAHMTDSIEPGMLSRIS